MFSGAVDLTFEETDAARDGFRGFALAAIVRQPAEVKALHVAALDGGAAEVKAPKKQLFGEFTATCTSPDGVPWKLAAESKKDKGPASVPPQPTETALYLGVASPKASAGFYTQLGMTTEHDYGDTFTDFAIAPGRHRLGLLTRAALAKDLGTSDAGADGTAGLWLVHVADSPQDVDELVSRAAGAGATDTGTEVDDLGGRTGTFTDADGYRWRVICRAGPKP